MIRLGSKVRDKINGFEGIAIGEMRWLTGCLRYTVEAPFKEKRVVESFDEHHLEILATPEDTGVHPFGVSLQIETEALAEEGSALAKSEGASPGGPMPTPSRHP